MLPSYQGASALQTPAFAMAQTRPEYGVHPLRLLDQLREVVRLKHYSLRTEDAYVAWIRRYIHFHRRRHPAGARSPEFARKVCRERGTSRSPVVNRSPPRWMAS